MFIVVLGVGLIFIIWKIIKQVRVMVKIDRLPGPKTVPYFGNALPLITTKYEDLGQLMKNMCREQSDKSLFRLWIFNYPVVIIKKASTAEAVLKSTNELSKSYMYNALHNWLGEGLLTSSGKKWTDDRKMLTPSFHFQILNSFVSIFNQKSYILMDKLQIHAKNNQYFDVLPYMTSCTLDIICDAAMGVNIDAQQNNDSPYVKAIVDLAKVISKRTCKPWLTLNSIYFFSKALKRKEAECLQIIHQFTNKVIEQRRAERKTRKTNNEQFSDVDVAGVKTRMRFLDTLLDIADRDGRLTDCDIREQVDTFMFGGFDTTACSLAWTLYFLGGHPNIQQHVQKELEAIFSNDKSRAVTSVDISRMKYLEAVIKESIRKVPIVPIFGRRLQNDLEIDGYVIPSGTEVIISPHSIHHDPEIYDEPDSFNPDRFLNGNRAGRHPYGFLGFSAGPRNCIGQKYAMMELKVILAHLLRNYSVVSRDNFEDIKIGMSLVAKPFNGIHLLLRHRN